MPRLIVIIAPRQLQKPPRLMLFAHLGKDLCSSASILFYKWLQSSRGPFDYTIIEQFNVVISL